MLPVDNNCSRLLLNDENIGGNCNNSNHNNNNHNNNNNINNNINSSNSISTSSSISYDSVETSVGISSEYLPHYLKCVESIKQMTSSFLKPQQSPLSRPMQRKLISLLQCQLVDGEGRSRAMRNARSIGERALSELLIKHQDPRTLSANLWAAVRARGCQFLGPAMQEEVLRLVLLALEDGSALSRKVLVMFVVQRLSPHFPHQASKTAIGHVIQLLYRASCFKLTKREGDSSLMQLKEEYRYYEALRREHDTQIVTISLEAGLRISPDQWSSLLYGDTAHKSHMQSIIDTLQSPQSFQQSIQELTIALQRTGDPAGLSPLKEHFEKLASIDPGLNNEYVTHPTHAELASILESSEIVTARLVEFLQHHANGMFRCTVRPSISSFPSTLTKNRNIIRAKPDFTLASGLVGHTSPIQSPIEVAKPSFHLIHRLKDINQRPCSSLIANRIVNSLPHPHLNDLHHHHFQTASAAGPPPSPSHPVAVAAAGPYLITGPARYSNHDHHIPIHQTKPITLATIPAILVDPTGGHPSPGSAILSSPELTGDNSTPVSPTSLDSPSSLSHHPPSAATETVSSNQLHKPNSSLPIAALPSDEDQFIPFDERPFVSKYGPISRAMNLINTPTVAGPGSSSQRACNNLVGGNHSATGTQPTNVMLGRTLPSLTLIQPLQQLVLTATTILTDAPQNYGHNQTLGLPDSSYPAAPVGNVVPTVSLA